MYPNDPETLDWAKYEGEILDLFVIQNKTLDQVTAHMQEKHNFQATYVTPILYPIETLDYEADDTNMTARGSTNTDFQTLRT